jgi:glycerol kinase
VWGSLDELAAQWALDVEVEPPPDRAAADAAHERWLAAVGRSRSWSG